MKIMIDILTVIIVFATPVIVYILVQKFLGLIKSTFRRIKEELSFHQLSSLNKKISKKRNPFDF